ncbi:MAG: hypothetical protein M1132_05890 [Chloroflexi bacterium]|nr:hypothetical protein [Chloroflexota bacterium]MCL5951242.1 hypothetical protein [Chloroflexota bacterium]
MVDETAPTASTTEKLLDPTDSLEIVRETMDQFLATADVQAVYGEPVQNGDVIVIPSAEVLSVMGFGVGTGGGRDESRNLNGGAGGGGGGRVLSRPVAAIIIQPDGAYVEPIVDTTKLGLAALTAAGFVIGMMLRMRARGR